jgi:hypothetical protein
MGHPISGMSNSAKRRAAVSEESRDRPEETTGILPAMQSRFSGFYTASKQMAVEAEHAVEERIQYHPILSVLLALGFGALAGSVCTMFCNRSRD